MRSVSLFGGALACKAPLAHWRVVRIERIVLVVLAQLAASSELSNNDVCALDSRLDGFVHDNPP